MTAAVFLTLGLGSVAYVRFRHDTGRRAFRRFSIAYGAVLTLVGVLSLASGVEEGRCPDDPTEFCRYNDSTPAMAFVVAVYVVVAAIDARILYNER